LEFELLQVVSGFVEDKTDGDVMGVHVHCSSVCYAVIQASSKKDKPERLVIAYHDENCLRDLIEAPSIVGLGFTSREEAMANLIGGIPSPTASKRMRRARPKFYEVQQHNDSAAGRAPEKDRGISIRILRCAFSTAIVLFYSKNLFSIILRTALGFSS
jgi:hypothetical protein